jgi:ubiquinone biosynthesis protein COQ9
MSIVKEDFRLAILDAALAHIPFDGWTLGALEAGAVDAGYPKIDAVRAFPDGPAEAAQFHSEVADRNMVAAFIEMETMPLRTKEKVAALVRLRLEGVAGQKEAVRLGFGLLSRPQNATRGLRALAKTADEIWTAVGDQSSDFNWYTKRGLVAAVYVSTVSYWLDDTSEGSQETWAFLDRRLDDAMRFPKKAAELFDKLRNNVPRSDGIFAALKQRRMARRW